MKNTVYDVILEPVITEKTTRDAKDFNKYAFKVHKSANKKEIKSAVEKVFSVHVENVHTSNYAGKRRRVRYQPGYTASWKKATVTLKKGDKIDFTS